MILEVAYSQRKNFLPRILFEYRPSHGRPPQDWQQRLPKGFTVERIDAAIAAQLQSDLVEAGIAPWFDTVWGSIERFLDGGFGFVVMHEGAIISNCRSWSITEGVAAIQVSTRSRYRQSGLATLVCCAFIERCAECGFTPEYSCDAENVASAALAEKLGFVRVGLVEETNA